MVTNGFMMDSICTLKMVNCNHLTENICANQIG